MKGFDEVSNSDKSHKLIQKTFQWSYNMWFILLTGAWASLGLPKK